MFEVNFYGFHGDTATVSFTSQPPSGKFTSVLDDSVTFANDDRPPPGNTLVHTQTYDLWDELEAADLREHDRQGYHVKAVVESEATPPGNRKQKVFWVHCEAPAQAVPMVLAHELAAVEQVDDADEEVADQEVAAEEVSVVVQEDVAVDQDVGVDEVEVLGLALDRMVAHVDQPAAAIDAPAEDALGVALAAERPAHQARVADALAITGLGIVTLLLLGLASLVTGGLALRRTSRR
jgi:hypothetical protein